MSRIAYLLALWGVFVMGAGFAAQGATRAERDAKNSSERTGPTASSIQSDNPSPHFFAARDAFNKRDNDACARELRLAGDIMKRDASEAKMWTAHKLRDAGSDLDTLAERVQRGQVNSVDDINQRVEQSYNALSDFHYQLARESYERNRKSGVTTGRDPETGQYLNAAANDLESWARYSGRAVEAGTRTAIDDTKSLAGKMISGRGMLPNGRERRSTTSVKRSRVLAGVWATESAAMPDRVRCHRPPCRAMIPAPSLNEDGGDERKSRRGRPDPKQGVIGEGRGRTSFFWGP